MLRQPKIIDVFRIQVKFRRLPAVRIFTGVTFANYTQNGSFLAGKSIVCKTPGCTPWRLSPLKSTHKFPCEVHVSIAIELAGLDVGAFHPFVEAVNPEDVGIALDRCVVGGAIEITVLAWPHEGLGRHTHIRDDNPPAVSSQPGISVATHSFGSPVLCSHPRTFARPTRGLNVIVGISGMADLVYPHTVETRTEKEASRPSAIHQNCLVGVHLRPDTGPGLLGVLACGQGHTIDIGEEDHRPALNAQEIGMPTILRLQVTDRFDGVTLIGSRPDVAQENDRRLEVRTLRFIEQCGEIAVGAVSGRRPLQGEAIDAGIAGHVDMFGNGCRIVGIVGPERIVTGADVAVAPAVAIKPGEVIGQHLALDSRLARRHRGSQGDRFGCGCGRWRGGRGRWSLQRVVHRYRRCT